MGSSEQVQHGDRCVSEEKESKDKKSNNENSHFKSVILSVVHFAFFSSPFSLLVPLDQAGNAD